MNKFLAICTIFLASGAYAQFIGVDNVSVPLYSNERDTIPIATIYQDSVVENYYNVADILDESDARFKVIITKAWMRDDFKLEAWIDKKYIAVCNNPSAVLDNSLYLFSQPDENSIKQVISHDNIIDWKSPLISVGKGRWYKIIVATKDGNKEGWTLNYCPYIYCSCEGG